MTQLSLFDAEKSRLPLAGADPDRVRHKLQTLLAEAKVKGLPQARRRFIETVVPQMVRWLPEDEAQRTKAAFEAALAA